MGIAAADAQQVMALAEFVCPLVFAGPAATVETLNNLYIAEGLTLVYVVGETDSEAAWVGGKGNARWPNTVRGRFSAYRYIPT